MGVRKGSFLFFMCVLVAGVAGWAMYQLIIEGAREFFTNLSSWNILGFHLTFLANYYIQNMLVIVGCLIVLFVVSGWGFKKALEEILD